MHVLEDLQSRNQVVSFPVITQRAGIGYNQLRKCYPELHALVRQAVADYEERRRASLTQARCLRVAEAAAPAW